MDMVNLAHELVGMDKAKLIAEEVEDALDEALELMEKGVTRTMLKYALQLAFRIYPQADFICSCGKPCGQSDIDPKMSDCPHCEKLFGRP